VAAGGIFPERVLPITLDVGTDNQSLLNDPFYLGVNQLRLKGEEYFSFVDEFMEAVSNRWPHVLVQFEDFNNSSALPILKKYRNKHLCFNDDIQGTGAVALSGVLASLRAAGLPQEKIRDQRIVCLGAGSAGLGVCNGIVWAMVENGLTPDQAMNQFWLVDKDGLLGQTRGNLSKAQYPFARKDQPNGLSLFDVVKRAKPTILLGLSGVGATFTEEIIREMAKNCDRPIIFPLSNPTSNAECTAEQAFKWSNGKAIVATGSPFDPVELNGKTYYTSQGNNMYIFPGLGLGATICKASRISDNMFFAAARTLSSCVTTEELEKGQVYPDITQIREVSKKVAIEVINVAFAEGVSRIPRPKNLEELVVRSMYVPNYTPLVYNKRHEQIHRFQY